MILCKQVRNLLEKKFNAPIKYSRDCDVLAIHIGEACKVSIGASTIARLLGFEKETNPRKSTLDVIATYLGFHSWSDLSLSLQPSDEITNTNSSNNNECLFICRYSIQGYSINFVHLGDHLFRIIESNHPKFQVGHVIGLKGLLINEAELDRQLAFINRFDDSNSNTPN